MTDQGVIYVATGERFLELAEISCESLKEQETDLAVAIFVDSALKKQVSARFDIVLLIDEPQFNFSDKIFGIQNSPFRKTIYLDCDTYVIDRIANDMFKALDYYPLLARTGVSFNYPWESENYVECINQLNTGVIAFEKERAADFISLWRTRSLKYPDLPDQPAFRSAMLDSKIPCAALAPAYNFMATNRCEIAVQKVRIVHFVNKKDVMLNDYKRGEVISRYRNIDRYCVVIKSYVVYDRDGFKIWRLVCRRKGGYPGSFQEEVYEVFQTCELYEEGQVLVGSFGARVSRVYQEQKLQNVRQLYKDWRRRRWEKRMLEGKVITCEVLQTICRKHVQVVTAPLVLVSEIQRSGGTMLAQLFDGHPEVHAHPPELHFGYPIKEHWPPIRLEDQPNVWFWMLLERTFMRYARNGYSKPNNESFRFLFLPDLQRRMFLDYVESQETVSTRTVFDAYMTSFFNAWLDNHNLLGEEKIVSGFAAGLSTDENNVSSFFDVYPEGKLISIMRDPYSWYVSAKHHKFREKWFKDINSAIYRWSESARGMINNKERYGDRVRIIRFEDLVGNTMSVMSHLSDWIGISFQETLLVPTFNGQPINANSSMKVKGTGILKGPLTRSETLTQEERSVIEREATDVYESVLKRCTEFPKNTMEQVMFSGDGR